MLCLEYIFEHKFCAGLHTLGSLFACARVVRMKGWGQQALQ